MIRVLKNASRSLSLDKERNMDDLGSWAANLKKRNDKLALIIWFKNWIGLMKKVLLSHIILQRLEKLDIALNQTK